MSGYYLDTRWGYWSGISNEMKRSYFLRTLNRQQNYSLRVIFPIMWSEQYWLCEGRHSRRMPTVDCSVRVL